MGRAERRRLERMKRIDENKSKISMPVHEYNQMKRQVVSETLEYNVEALMTCFALTGRRLHGYGKKRIFRDLDYIDKLMGDIIEGKATMEDYKKELEDEAGVRITC